MKARELLIIGCNGVTLYGASYAPAAVGGDLPLIIDDERLVERVVARNSLRRFFDLAKFAA